MTVRYILLASFWAVSSAEARTWHIRADGSGDAPTIQAGIDSAATGDSILVASGQYDENLLIPSGRSLHLRGLNGAQLTVVDGGRRARVLTIRGTGTVEGFTLRRGQGSVGGGIAVIGSSNAVIRNNIIEENIASSPGFGSGGGVYTHFDTEGILIESNIIRSNSSGENGGGICLRGGVFNELHEVRNNVIEGNSSYLGGGGVSMGWARLLGNVVANNSTLTAGGGIFVELDGGGEIRNNTIVRNQSGDGAGIEIAGSPLISHNIIVHNTPGAGAHCGAFAAHPTFECNDIWGNGSDSVAGCGTTGPGNFSADPLFCDEQGGDYHLDWRSPCLLEENPTCGLVGALTAACGDVGVEERTWGGMKALFR